MKARPPARDFDEHRHDADFWFLTRQESDVYVAAALLHRQGRDSFTSRELEEYAGLRQPEVSVGLKYWREQGLLETWGEKRSGRGRPVQHYKLDVKGGAKFIERRVKQDANQTENTLAKLRERLNGHYSPRTESAPTSIEAPEVESVFE